MSRIRVGVLGNCQAGPLSYQIRSLVPSVEIDTVITVHLAKDADRDENYEVLDRVDLILAQRVADNYPCTHVRNSELAEAFGDKIVVWPNLYYQGYNPELQYIRSGTTRAPLPGPLGDYHLRTVVDGWQFGLDADQVTAQLMSADYNRERYAGIPESSLDELREREAGCDIVISDWIERERWSQRLFFTFNHPTSAALRELVRRTLEHTSLPALDRPEQHGPAEPLGRYRLPINPWISTDFAPGLTGPDRYQGSHVEFHGGRATALKQPIRHLAPVELVNEAYRVYDATLQRVTLEDGSYGEPIWP